MSACEIIILLKSSDDSWKPPIGIRASDRKSQKHEPDIYKHRRYFQLAWIARDGDEIYHLTRVLSNVFDHLPVFLDMSYHLQWRMHKHIKCHVSDHPGNETKQ